MTTYNYTSLIPVTGDINYPTKISTFITSVGTNLTTESTLVEGLITSKADKVGIESNGYLLQADTFGNIQDSGILAISVVKLGGTLVPGNLVIVDSEGNLIDGGAPSQAGSPDNISSLTDTSITGPLQNKDVLVYDSTSAVWKDQSYTEAGIAAAGHNHTVAAISGLGALATLNVVNLQTQVTGTLQIANGGTGATSAAGAVSNIGAQPYNGRLVDIAATTPGWKYFLVGTGSSWGSQSPASAKASLAITTADVSGLGLLASANNCVVTSHDILVDPGISWNQESGWKPIYTGPSITTTSGQTLLIWADIGGNVAAVEPTFRIQHAEANVIEVSYTNNSYYNDTDQRFSTWGISRVSRTGTIDLDFYGVGSSVQCRYLRMLILVLR